MINISCANYNHILAIVVRSMEVNNHVPLNLIDIVYIPKDRLTYHMILKAIKIDSFHKSFHIILICG